jgi:hypothetical protein
MLFSVYHYVSALDVDLGNDTTMCHGNNLILNAGNPGCNYLWNTGATSQSINAVTAGIYSVTVTNSDGCTDADSVTITEITMAAPTITGSINHCVNSGYYYYTTEPGMNNYQWSVSPGATVIYGNGTPELIVTWDQPGAQWIRVNYTNAGGCTAINPSQLNVTVNPLPGLAGTITGPATVCAGTTGIAYSTAVIANAATYVWSLPPGATIATGAGTSSITVDFGVNAQPGNITVYGNNLCGNGSVSPALAVNVGALPGLAGIPVGEPVVCEGDTGVIYYVPPIFNAASYFWEIQGGGLITAGNGTNSIRAKFPTGPANCLVTVVGLNTCGQGQISPALEVTVNPTPDTPTITRNGEMLVSSAPAGNQWYLNGVIIPNATQQSYAPIVTGHYSVQVTLEGCSSEWSDQYYYIMTGIAAPSGWQATLWPNPNKGSFSVSLKGIPGEQVSITVINSLGVRIHEQRFALSSSEGEMQIDMRAAAPGVYMVMIEAGRVTRGLKMVLE